MLFMTVFLDGEKDREFWKTLAVRMYWRLNSNFLKNNYFNCGIEQSLRKGHGSP